MGKLYLIATPIGNLKDISLRAIEMLFSVDAVACEDTRKAGLLFETIRVSYQKLFSPTAEIPQRPQFISYYEQNELRRIPEIVSLLHKGLDIALISDAGTPAISDPGFKLVRECVAQGIQVESLPGASSVLTALVISGLPTDKFLFAGYPPQKPGQRKKFFENLRQSYESLSTTVVFFEAPHKLLKSLETLQSVIGDVPIVVCRELTKIHEEVRRETISQLLEHFQTKKPRGEFVLLFHL